MASNYERDFYSWTREQAGLLKNRDFNKLDLKNIIEEIETLGRSEYRELESRLTILLIHLLKWQFQPEKQSKSWKLTIDVQRKRLVKVLTENPGLKSKLNQMLSDAYELAVVDATAETNLDIDNFPKRCLWDFNQLIDVNFYPS